MYVSNKILLVEDEREIADLITLYLQNENYSVFQCASAKEAFSYIDSETFDLAILDVMLPDASGLTICKKIREAHTYPIIMLTAKSSEVDKITGLTVGADDYVTKPFLPLELVARVKAQQRRYTKYNDAAKADTETIAHLGLVLNVRTHSCYLNEKPMPLTPTEFSILRILCENKGNAVSAEQLCREIWGETYYDKANNTITVHIRHLREKLNDSYAKPRYIKTVWGVGYKIEQ